MANNEMQSRLNTAPTASDGWIKWNGGENPVPGKIVEVKLRGGHQSTCHKSEDETWYVVGDNYDIIAYRVVD
mgnify:CR=1 FL=1